MISSLARLVFSVTLLVSLTAKAAPYEFVNGHWFEGERFVQRTVYSDGGVFLEEPPTEFETIDLEGGFVVPPFAEAHNHDLASEWELDKRIEGYLRDGVFYVKMQSAFSPVTERIRNRFGHSASVDVSFAFAPVTGPGGHPIKLREVFFERGHYEGEFETKEEIAGIGYTLVRDAEDLTGKWNQLLAQAPDFVKFMLSNSEEYEFRRDDPAFFGQKGLDPALAPRLVELTHAAGLRITAHISTGPDFHHAVAADVDEIAHLPGVRQPEVIREVDARLAAEKGIVVVTTISLTAALEDGCPSVYERVMDQHVANLKTLRNAGVTIAVGSDMPFRDTSVGEAFMLHRLGVFTNLELLKMWTINSARTIFPDRKLGELKNGYEASFLVLEGDPLADFSQVRNIRMRFKQGQPLEVSTL